MVLFSTTIFFWAVIGLILFKIIIQIPISYILKWSGWGYVACLFMIFLTVIGLGQNINGAQRWLSLGPIQIQPSELLKPFFDFTGGNSFWWLEKVKLDG